MAPRTPSVKINVQGARGESQADILRRTGQYGVKPTDTDTQAMAKLNAVAIQAANDAQAAKDGAVAAVNYRPTIALGIADFPVGSYFTSDDQDSVTSHAGELRTYKRIAASPFYEDMGDSAAPASSTTINVLEKFAGQCVYLTSFDLPDLGRNNTQAFYDATQKAIEYNLPLIISAGKWNVSGLSAPLEGLLRIKMEPGAHLQGVSVLGPSFSPSGETLFPLGTGADLEIEGYGAYIENFYTVFNVAASSSSHIHIKRIRINGVELANNRIAAICQSAANITADLIEVPWVRVRDGWSGLFFGYGEVKQCNYGFIDLKNLVVPSDVPTTSNLYGTGFTIGSSALSMSSNVIGGNLFADTIGDMRDGRQVNAIRIIADVFSFNNVTIRNLFTGDARKDDCEGFYSYASRMTGGSIQCYDAGYNQGGVAIKGHGTYPDGKWQVDQIIVENSGTEPRGGMIVNAANGRIGYYRERGCGRVTGVRELFGALDINRENDLKSLVINYVDIETYGVIGLDCQGWFSDKFHILGGYIKVTGALDPGGIADRYGIRYGVRDPGVETLDQAGGDYLLSNVLIDVATNGPGRSVSVGRIRIEGTNKASLTSLRVKGCKFKAKQAYYFPVIPGDTVGLLDIGEENGNDYSECTSGFSGIFTPTTVFKKTELVKYVTTDASFTMTDQDERIWVNDAVMGGSRTVTLPKLGPVPYEYTFIRTKNSVSTNNTTRTWQIADAAGIIFHRMAIATKLVVRSDPILNQWIVVSYSPLSDRPLKSISLNGGSPDYTFALGDEGFSAIVSASNLSTGVRFDIPADVFPLDAVVAVIQGGSNALTVQAGVGVTINKPSSLTIAGIGQYNGIIFRQTASNVWLAQAGTRD